MILDRFFSVPFWLYRGNLLNVPMQLTAGASKSLIYVFSLMRRKVQSQSLRITRHLLCDRFCYRDTTQTSSWWVTFLYVWSYTGHLKPILFVPIISLRGAFSALFPLWMPEMQMFGAAEPSLESCAIALPNQCGARYIQRRINTSTPVNGIRNYGRPRQSRRPRRRRCGKGKYRKSETQAIRFIRRAGTILYIARLSTRLFTSILWLKCRGLNHRASRHLGTCFAQPRAFCATAALNSGGRAGGEKSAVDNARGCLLLLGISRGSRNDKRARKELFIRALRTCQSLSARF